jgi:energy-coupling factor transporter ATP-binding protein EcfA2
MINFPVFEQLEVKNYGLYPGTSEQPGIVIDFKPGLTLILGANGLGKTTLVTILYRMLAGAYDLPRTTLEAAELGGASLDVKPLNANDKALFANRVQDLATDATAVLRLSIANKRLTIRRHLKNLNLISLHYDNSRGISDETEYQKLLPELSGVPNFGDWLLLLRHMVFYFEDRRELIWDSSAQRHIFRMIFLPPQEAKNWYRQEREILRLDSRYRNDMASLNRLKKRITANDKALGDEASLRAELVSLTKLQEEDEMAYGALVADADTLDTRRHRLRKDLLGAELEADKCSRAIESEKLALLKRYFPSDKQTALHLYSLLIAHNQCAVCGNEATSAAEELSDRATNHQCVVCGSGLRPDLSSENVISFSQARIQHLHEMLKADRARVTALKSALADISKRYDAVATRLIDTRAAIAERAKQISRIENALPKDDTRQDQARSELSALSEALAGDKAELNRLATSFKDLVDQANTRILQHSDAIKNAFAEFAGGFLAEDAQLKWSPVSETLGETGIAKIVFPAFDLEMSGSDFTIRALRTGPESVSESQREFIDLAFRMALIQVAGEGVGGSLVIDAPESSLDAFFVKRAANVLCRFGKPDSNNRLVVASNLIDGQLLPEMIKGGIPPGEQGQRLVNLMEVAIPTAALRDNRLEYKAELQKILASGGLCG